MGRAAKTRKISVKRMIGKNDARVKDAELRKLNPNQLSKDGKRNPAKTAGNDELVREIPNAPSHLFFQYNTSLTPPYQVLLDTNFFSHTIRAKLELIPSLMDALYATVNPLVTSCIIAELEKLGPKYRLALQVAKDPKIGVLKCQHRGVYADDCIVDRIVKDRVYLVGTNDRELKRRIRKIPGVPVVSVARGRYTVERLPDAPEH